MTHPQDCISSLMNSVEGWGILPTQLDYTVAANWIWTRADSSKVKLEDMTRKDLAVLTAFVEKKTKKLSMSIVSYQHLMDDDKAQDAADQLAFLHEARTMLTLEAQRRFAIYLSKQNTVAA